jgi:hypothetical protein
VREGESFTSTDRGAPELWDLVAIACIRGSIKKRA